MTTLDPSELNPDTLIAHVYQAQADLKILAHWLAYEASPALPIPLLYTLGALHVQLNELTPTARH